MRKHLSTIHLFLLLAPFLCFAVLGNIPHSHGCRCSPSAYQNFRPTPTGVPSIQSAYIGNFDDSGNCPLCVISAEFNACASLPISVHANPSVASEKDIAREFTATTPFFAPSSPRAPPQFFS